MAKKKGKEKKKTKKWELYEVKGEELVRKRKICPKCGGGVFMAQHKDRLSCGKCGYSESMRTTTPETSKNETSSP